MNAELAQGLLDDMAQRVPSNLIDFGRALDSWLGGANEFEWAYFLEKPWKWAGEYALWANLNYPQDGDGQSWDEFVNTLDTMAAS